VILFDSWRRTLFDRLEVQNCIAAWTSLPIGVVNLAERHGGRDVTRQSYEAMVADVMTAIEGFEAKHRFGARIATKRAHFLGTSGTVTTISGIHLGLPVYERSRVDGCWLNARDVRTVSNNLIEMSYAERVASELGDEMEHASLARELFFSGAVGRWMVPVSRLHRGVRQVLQDLLACRQPYRGLTSRLVRAALSP